MVVEHTSIEGCRRNWTGTGESPVAGQAMSKALRAVGLSMNPTGPSRRISINCDWDSYNVTVPTLRSDEVVAELRKDRRVTKIDVDGVEVPKQKTVEELEAELAAFKTKVVEVALQKAKDHDWCDVVKAALREMGLEIPKEKARVVLEIDLNDTGVDGDDLDSIREHLRWAMSKPDIQDSVVSTELVKG